MKTYYVSVSFSFETNEPETVTDQQGLTHDNPAWQEQAVSALQKRIEGKEIMLETFDLDDDEESEISYDN